jgi:hypothetical protein
LKFILLSVKNLENLRISELWTGLITAKETRREPAPAARKTCPRGKKCLSVSEFYLYSPVALISFRRFFGIHRMKLGKSRGREALLGNALLGKKAHD